MFGLWERKEGSKGEIKRERVRERPAQSCMTTCVDRRRRRHWPSALYKLSINFTVFCVVAAFFCCCHCHFAARFRLISFRIQCWPFASRGGPPNTSQRQVTQSYSSKYINTAYVHRSEGEGEGGGGWRWWRSTSYLFLEFNRINKTNNQNTINSIFLVLFIFLPPPRWL